MLYPGGHSSSSIYPTRFNSQRAHDSQPICGCIKVSQCVLILRVEKKGVCVLQRASTEATWITAPEVSRKAVNINDSSHPHPTPPPQGFFSQTVVTSAAFSKGKVQSRNTPRLARLLLFFFFFQAASLCNV